MTAYILQLFSYMSFMSPLYILCSFWFQSFPLSYQTTLQICHLPSSFFHVRALFSDLGLALFIYLIGQPTSTARVPPPPPLKVRPGSRCTDWVGAPARRRAHVGGDATSMVNLSGSHVWRWRGVRGRRWACFERKLLTDGLGTLCWPAVGYLSDNAAADLKLEFMKC